MKQILPQSLIVIMMLTHSVACGPKGSLSGSLSSRESDKKDEVKTLENAGIDQKSITDESRDTNSNSSVAVEPTAVDGAYLACREDPTLSAGTLTAVGCRLNHVSNEDFALAPKKIVVRNTVTGAVLPDSSVKLLDNKSISHFSFLSLDAKNEYVTIQITVAKTEINFASPVLPPKSAPYTGTYILPLVASQEYGTNPAKFNGRIKLPANSTYKIPASVTVLAGNAGNSIAQLVLGAIELCQYKAQASSLNPTDETDKVKGRTYVFDYCFRGSKEGSSMTEPDISLVIEAGDKTQDRTLSQISIEVQGDLP